MATAQMRDICGGTHMRPAACDGPTGRKATQQGVYLIERAAETVLAVMTPQRLGLFGRAASARVMHQRQTPIRGASGGGRLQEARNYEEKPK